MSKAQEYLQHMHLPRMLNFLLILIICESLKLGNIININQHNCRYAAENNLFYSCCPAEAKLKFLCLNHWLGWQAHALPDLNALLIIFLKPMCVRYIPFICFMMVFILFYDSKRCYSEFISIHTMALIIHPIILLLNETLPTENCITACLLDNF